MNAMTSTNINTEFQKVKGRLFLPVKGTTNKRKGAGFLAALLCKLEFRWTTDIPTAAISATTLYWNPDFFQKLDPETRITVLAHEIWHNAMLHGARRGNRCPDIWNIAGDHVINNLLDDHGYYMEGFPYVMDPKYKGWSTEDVYDDLIQNGGAQFLPGGLGADIKPMSEADKNTTIGNVVGAIATARMTGAAGDLPGELTSMIDEFLNPKLPWEIILFNFFNALTAEEYSFARPNRRYEDPILPGITGRNGLEHLYYFVDASGSITDQQILRANSEIKFIQEELRPERLTIVVFDTHIRSVRDFEIDEPYEKIEIVGGGGTNLEHCWKFLYKNRPTAAVVFTDLYVDIPPNPGVPVIWIAVDNKTAQVPYGQLIHLTE